MSLTSRLFLAMRICRELTPGPNPCNRCWVKPKVSDELVAGLKSLRGLLLAVLVLFNPRLTVVPVRKDCWIPKLPTSCVWMSELVPVRKALVCGVVKWPQLKPPVSIGTAFVDRGRCLPWAMQTPCIVCEEMCPTDPKAIWFEEAVETARDGTARKLQRPRVDAARCVGCGICENKCPVGEEAAIRVTSVGETRDPLNRLLAGSVQT